MSYDVKALREGEAANRAHEQAYEIVAKFTQDPEEAMENSVLAMRAGDLAEAQVWATLAQATASMLIYCEISGEIDRRNQR